MLLILIYTLSAAVDGAAAIHSDSSLSRSLLGGAAILFALLAIISAIEEAERNIIRSIIKRRYPL